MIKFFIIFFVLVIGLGLVAGYKSNWNMCDDTKIC